MRSVTRKRSLKRAEPGFARTLGRIGITTRQPLVWMSFTGALAVTGKPDLERAAARGFACYLAGAGAGNGVKLLFHRPQPRHLRPKKPEIMRGSFPSGHGAAEVAYVFGAAQEAPVLFLPLAAAALLAHWSLVRARKHYVSDLLLGGTLGFLIALGSAAVIPVAGSRSR